MAAKNAGVPEWLSRSACEMLQVAGALHKEAAEFRARGNLYDAYLRLALCIDRMQTAETYVNNSVPLGCTDVEWCLAAENGRCAVKATRERVQAELATLEPLVRDALKSTAAAGAGADTANEACAAVVRFRKGTAECGNWFDRIIGQAAAKATITQSFISPILYPNLFGKLAKGVLLYGPPGTGKTLLAKAAINELRQASNGCVNVIFFAPQTGDLKGKYVGETEQKIEALFQGASRVACSASRQPTVAVIFLDEVDGLAPRGRGGEGASAQIAASAVNTLLQQMDGIDSPKNVVVIAATNYPWNLDPAFLRRFTAQVFVDLPDMQDTLMNLHMLVSTFFTGMKTPEQVQASFTCKADAKTGEACDGNSLVSDCEPEPLDVFQWQKLAEFVKYSPLKPAPNAANKPDNDPLLEVAKLLHPAAELNKSVPRYSPSDVARLFADAARTAADEALKNARFFPVSITLAQRPTTVYVPTLCLDPLAPFPGPAIALHTPAVHSITITETVNGQKRVEKFVNYLEAQRNLALADPRINDMYVYEDPSHNLHVLFEVLLPTTQAAQPPAPPKTEDEEAEDEDDEEDTPQEKNDKLIDDIYNAIKVNPAQVDSLTLLTALQNTRVLPEQRQKAVKALERVHMHEGRTITGRALFRLEPAALDKQAGVVGKFFDFFNYGKTAEKQVGAGFAGIFDAIRNGSASAYVKRVYVGSVASWKAVDLSNRVLQPDFFENLQAGRDDPNYQTPYPLFSADASPLLLPAAWQLDKTRLSNLVNPEIDVVFDVAATPVASTAEADKQCKAEFARNAQMVAWNLSAKHLIEATKRVKPTVESAEYATLKRYANGEVDAVLAERNKAS